MVFLIDVSCWGCCTARGSSAGFFRFSPTKVEARKSYILTESIVCIVNKENMVDFIVTLYSYITLLQCKRNQSLLAHLDSTLTTSSQTSKTLGFIDN